MDLRSGRVRAEGIDSHRGNSDDPEATTVRVDSSVTAPRSISQVSNTTPPSRKASGVDRQGTSERSKKLVRSLITELSLQFGTMSVKDAKPKATRRVLLEQTETPVTSRQGQPPSRSKLDFAQDREPKADRDTTRTVAHLGGEISPLSQLRGREILVPSAQMPHGVTQDTAKAATDVNIHSLEQVIDGDLHQVAEPSVINLDHQTVVKTDHKRVRAPEKDLGPATSEKDLGPATYESDLGVVGSEMDLGAVVGSEMDLGAAATISEDILQHDCQIISGQRLQEESSVEVIADDSLYEEVYDDFGLSEQLSNQETTQGRTQDEGIRNLPSCSGPESDLIERSLSDIVRRDTSDSECQRSMEICADNHPLHGEPEILGPSPDITSMEGAVQMNAHHRADEFAAGTPENSDFSLGMATFLNTNRRVESNLPTHIGQEAVHELSTQDSHLEYGKSGLVAMLSGDLNENGSAQHASSRQAIPTQMGAEEQRRHQSEATGGARAKVPATGNQSSTPAQSSETTVQGIDLMNKLLQEITYKQSQMLSAHEHIDMRFEKMEQRLDAVVKEQSSTGLHRQRAGPLITGGNPSQDGRKEVEEDRVIASQVSAEMSHNHKRLVGDRRSRTRRETRVPAEFLESPSDFQFQRKPDIAMIGGRAVYSAPAKFTGEGNLHLRIWLRQIHDKQMANCWSDEATAKLMLDLCEDRARHAVDQVVRDGFGGDKVVLTEALWLEFCGRAKMQEARHILHHISQREDESYYEFARKVENLCYTAFPDRTPDYAVNHALIVFEVGILDAEIKREMFRYPPESLQEAVQMAESYAVSKQLATMPSPHEGALAIEASPESVSEDDALIAALIKRKQNFSGGQTKPKATAEAPAKADGSVSEQLQGLRKDLSDFLEKFEKMNVGRGRASKRGNARGKQPKPGQKSSGTKNNACFRCGKPGHWAKDCAAQLCGPCHGEMKDVIIRDLLKNE